MANQQQDITQNPTYIISYQDIVEYLLKKHGIHEGIWGIAIQFRFAGINVGDPAGTVLPSAIAGINKIGITPFPQESSIAFDAAKLNPPKGVKGKGKRKAQDFSQSAKRK